MLKFCRPILWALVFVCFLPVSAKAQWVYFDQHPCDPSADPGILAAVFGEYWEEFPEIDWLADYLLSSDTKSSCDPRIPHDENPPDDPCTEPCSCSPDPYCGSNDPCCGNSDPCCGSSNPCCGNPNPCCGSSNPCCGNPDPCCGSTDPCCGDPDPCCGNPNSCCNPSSSCCGDPNPCCNPSSPCCGDPDPCCDTSSPCCGNPDPCCSDPCCDDPDPCCGNPDPCCGSSDPCCGNTDPCDPECGDPCDPACIDCDDDNDCTDDWCVDGECQHSSPCVPPEVCCGGECCPAENCCPGSTAGVGGTCCGTVCEECLDNGELSPGSIELSANPVCVGETITFTVLGVTDSGGSKRENCQVVVIPPAPLLGSWVVTKPSGATISGSGLAASIVTDEPGTYSCAFTVTAPRECPPPGIEVGPVMGIAGGVSALVWEPFAPASTPLDTCPNNGDKRIFPDHVIPNDPNSGIRNKVKLTVSTSPSVPGCTVYFKTFDVDDPFDQNNPNLANVSVVDNNTSGPDNRGGLDPGVGLWNFVTDQQGKASIAVTVSTQPGNNYRAAASTIQNAIASVTQSNADANSPPNSVVFSDMLTVWRKLHVEVDSMGAVTGNEISTPFTDFVGLGTNLTEIRGMNSINDGSLDLDSKPPGNGRFENGTAIVGTAPSTITLSPIVANGHNKVTFSGVSIAGLPFSARDNDSSDNSTIGGTITQIVKAGANSVWTLSVTSQSETPIDWPDFVGGTLSVGGGASVLIVAATGAFTQITTSALNIPCALKDDDDNTVLPKAPDTTAMAAAYQPAYVVPVYDVGDNNMNVPFVLNVADNDAAIDATFDWDSRSANTPNFWVAYVLQAFQGPFIKDNDPNSGVFWFGVMPGSGGGSLIFLELHQAHEGITNPLAEERDTVVHETGHAVGNSGQEDVTDFQSHFLATYLVNIRSSTRPSP